MHVVVRHGLPDNAVDVDGLVHDPQGRPLAGVWIWATRDIGHDVVEPLLQTDANGRFRTCQPGWAILEARPQGMLAKGIRIDPDDGATFLDFCCEPQGSAIEGLVADADGRAIAGATVQVGDEWDLHPRGLVPGDVVTSGVPALLYTDAEGRFSLDGLAAGVVRVRARAPGLAPACFDIDVPAAGTASAHVQLAAGATVRGVVVDEYGDPAPFELVRTELAAGEGRSVATDAEGRFEMHGLPPGDVVMFAGTGPAGFARGQLTLAPGAAVEWNAALSPDARRIAGRVVDPNGKPGRFSVVIDSPRQVVRTGPDGSFSFMVQDFRFEHLCALYVFEAGTVERDMMAHGCALLSLSGVAPGETKLELRVPAVARTASVRGELVIDDPADLGRLYLVDDHWSNRVLLLPKARATGTPTAWNCTDMPPGRYRLMLDFRQIARFELGEGQQLDLGPVVAGLHAARIECDADKQAHVIMFVPPPLRSRRGELLAEVFDTAGTSLGWFSPRWLGGAWELALSLPPGDYRIVADDGTDLTACVSLAARDGVFPTYARRVPLQRH
jgi:hypothetical protein